MAGTGYKTAGTGENVAGADVDWSDPTNIQAQSGSTATGALSGPSNTDLLRATNFDFANLDSSDTIVGISVQLRIGLSSGSDNDAGLSIIQLVLGGSTQGDDLISGIDNLLAAFTTLTYGGSSNLWGATPSIANAQTSTFGVQLVGVRVASTLTIAVMYVQMAIHVANSNTVWATSSARSTIRSRG